MEFRRFDQHQERFDRARSSLCRHLLTVPLNHPQQGSAWFLDQSAAGGLPSPHAPSAVFRTHPFLHARSRQRHDCGCRCCSITRFQNITVFTRSSGLFHASNLSPNRKKIMLRNATLAGAMILALSGTTYARTCVCHLILWPAAMIVPYRRRVRRAVQMAVPARRAGPPLSK